MLVILSLNIEKKICWPGAKLLPHLHAPYQQPSEMMIWKLLHTPCTHVLHHDVLPTYESAETLSQYDDCRLATPTVRTVPVTRATCTAHECLIKQHPTHPGTVHPNRDR